MEYRGCRKEEEPERNKTRVIKRMKAEGEREGITEKGENGMMQKHFSLGLYIPSALCTAAARFNKHT